MHIIAAGAALLLGAIVSLQRTGRRLHVSAELDNAAKTDRERLMFLSRTAAVASCVVVFLLTQGANTRADLRHDESPDQDHLNFGRNVQQVANDACLYVIANYQGTDYLFSGIRLTSRLALIPMHAIRTATATGTVVSVGTGIDPASNPGATSSVYAVHPNSAWDPNDAFGPGGIDCAVLEINLPGPDAAFDFIGPITDLQTLKTAGRGLPGTPSTGYGPADGKLVLALPELDVLLEERFGPD